MNKSQVCEFIAQVRPSLDVKVRYYSSKSDGCAAQADTLCSILYLNTDYLKRENYTSKHFFKAIILHELGHIVKRHTRTNARNELSAQLFALDVADKLGMVMVFRRLLLELCCWGSINIPFSKAELYITYYQAYRLFLKDKKLVKKLAKKHSRIEALILYDLKNPLPKFPKIIEG